MTALQTLLRHPWLNLPAALFVLVVTIMGVEPARAAAYLLGFGLAALAVWRSRRLIRRSLDAVQRSV